MTADPTRSIAEYVCALSFDDLPTPAVDQAKLGILDTLGVALAGSQHRVGEIITEYVRSACATGPSWVIGSAFHTAPEWAALANATMSHALDFDDRGHASTHTLFPALAVGVPERTSGQDLLLSYVVGREVRMHLNAEFDTGRFEGEGRGPGSRGWHATGTFGSLGAVAAAAKVLGLGPDTTQTAFGIAGSLASGLIANFGTMAKPLHAGNAARNGVLATSLARAGFTAEPEILTARRGMVDAFCLPGECDASRVATSLREYFHIVKAGVRIKPYPSCTSTHRYIEALHQLLAERAIEPGMVRSITVTHSESLNRPYPADDVEAKFSGAFAVAATLVDGAITLENCNDEFLRRPIVKRLITRTRYVPRDGDREFFRIELESGETIERSVAPLRNLTTWDEVREKFEACATPVIGPEGTATVVDLVAGLESLETLQPLTDLLGGGQAGARSAAPAEATGAS